MMRLGSRQAPFLSLAVGNMFEPGAEIEIERGKRGGVKSARVGDVSISGTTLKAMEKHGYIKDGKITSEGHSAFLEHLRRE